ncbi:hypothetical protein L210DRAFT_3061081 [Boletus edulis BED1]|uniref:Uncharacterized protein n=1 Tax=Boletus edulis BED1 TaxID=1328754 RepID=A0AAD4GI47_BOLED|nr:hypothetical protein L210DRAFT_3061081 [Boletus edulis BED1]
MGLRRFTLTGYCSCCDSVCFSLAIHLIVTSSVPPEEGKRCVRAVADWQDTFMMLITDRNYAPLVRLVAIVAYYEASCDPDAPKSHASPPIGLPQDMFLDAKECLKDILAAHMPRDGPRVVVLLRSLTKHQILRERILSLSILEPVVELFDAIIEQQTESFGQAMDCLSCLLQCEDTGQFFIEKLRARSPNSNVSRLSHILKVDDSHLLIAALRMVLTLARIPEEMCAL